jgi:6-phosphofructokinase 2
MSIVTVTLNPCIDKTFSVDRVIADRKLTGRDVRVYPGGGGINVARAVTRLGVEARALWSCGGDVGRHLTRLLDAEHVPHVPVPIDGEVRENLIVLDESSGEQYRFGMPGPRFSQADRARWLEAVQGIAPSVEYVVFSGSLPDAAPGDWYQELLRTVRSGTRIIVDSAGAALRRALDRGVFLIKPNQRELGEVVGRELVRETEIEEAASEIVAGGGAEVVVVSLGRGGAVCASKEGAARFLAPAVLARSKVGAGDSMVAGLTAGLIQGRSLGDAVRLGVAAGSAAVMNEGTELCRREDTERLYQHLRRHEVSPARGSRGST